VELDLLEEVLGGSKTTDDKNVLLVEICQFRSILMNGKMCVASLLSNSPVVLGFVPGSQ
jgi:hypothetical protein